MFSWTLISTWVSTERQEKNHLKELEGTGIGVLPVPRNQSAKFQRTGTQFPLSYSSPNWTSLPGAGTRGIKDTRFLEVQPKQEPLPLLAEPLAGSVYPSLQTQTAKSCSSPSHTIPLLLGEFPLPLPLPTCRAAPAWLGKEIGRDSWSQRNTNRRDEDLIHSPPPPSHRKE